MVFRRIGKSGNSLYVSIPQSFLAYLELGQGDYTAVTLVKGKIIIEPARDENKPGVTLRREKNG